MMTANEQVNDSEKTTISDQSDTSSDMEEESTDFARYHSKVRSCYLTLLKTTDRMLRLYLILSTSLGGLVADYTNRGTCLGGLVADITNLGRD